MGSCAQAFQCGPRHSIQNGHISNLQGRRTQKHIKQRQKQSFDRRHRAGALRRLAPGEHVWVTGMDRRGRVMSEVGQHAPRSYIARTRLGDVRRNRRHLDPTTIPAAAPPPNDDIDTPSEEGEIDDPGDGANTPWRLRRFMGHVLATSDHRGKERCGISTCKINNMRDTKCYETLPGTRNKHVTFTANCRHYNYSLIHA